MGTVETEFLETIKRENALTLTRMRDILSKDKTQSSASCDAVMQGFQRTYNLMESLFELVVNKTSVPCNKPYIPASFKEAFLVGLVQHPLAIAAMFGMYLAYLVITKTPIAASLASLLS